MTYLITFSCHGNHLHGDEQGSVDRLHHTYQSRLADPDPERAFVERVSLREPPYSMPAALREIVLKTIQDVCLHRGWSLHAAHVRSTHVHVVAEGDDRPEAMMIAFKAYASRALNRVEPGGDAKTRWARHGSTRWLWDRVHVNAAVEYVVEGQGDPMAVYVAEWTGGQD